MSLILSFTIYSNFLIYFFKGLTDWEDAGLLAQVLAASQQEYLDKLKKSRDAADDTVPTTMDGSGSSSQQQQREPTLELQQGRSDNGMSEGGVETSNGASGSNNS